jgi:hypothetical protein
MIVRVSSRKKKRKTDKDGEERRKVIKILKMKRSLSEVMKFSHNIAVMQMCY